MGVERPLLLNHENGTIGVTKWILVHLMGTGAITDTGGSMNTTGAIDGYWCT
jgi:hypothetical protein